MEATVSSEDSSLLTAAFEHIWQAHNLKNPGEKENTAEWIHRVLSARKESLCSKQMDERKRE